MVQISETAPQTLSTQSDPDYFKEAKAWLRFGFKVGVGCVSTFALSQIAYSYLLSPNYLGNSKETSPTFAFYNRYADGCSSLAFKSERILFNLFETWAPIYRFFGFKSETPGDMQGFILDQNSEALKCAYPSAEHVSKEAKNRLLAKVLRVMNFEKRDLSNEMEWLVQQGADPNLALNVDLEDLRHVKEKSLTPLMTAYRAQNLALFKFLLSQGANVSQKLLCFSNKTHRFDFNQPLILAVVNDIIRSGVESKEKCHFYKNIVDLSLSELKTANNLFSNLDAEELQALVYRAIKTSLCDDTFNIEETDEEEVEEILADDDVPSSGPTLGDSLSELWSDTKVWLSAAGEALKEKIKEWAEGEGFNMRYSGVEMTRTEAYNILGLKGRASKSDIKKAYRSLSRKHHPDKDKSEGAVERFEKIQKAYEYLIPKKDPKPESSTDSDQRFAREGNDWMDELLKTHEEVRDED